MAFNIILKQIRTASIILSLLLSTTVRADAPVTLLSSKEYKDQRKCALGCFKFNQFDGIANFLRCDYQKPKNDCYCRNDLQNKAVEFVSSCVNRVCDGAEIDIDKATNVYKNYCTSNGYTDLPAKAEATPTAAAKG